MGLRQSLYANVNIQSKQQGINFDGIRKSARGEVTDRSASATKFTGLKLKQELAASPIEEVPKVDEQPILA